MISLASESASMLDTVDKMSQKIGISREAYQEWDYILSQSGADVSGLQTSIKTLSTAASEAKDGTAEYKDEFDRLGVSVVDTDGNLKDSETLFNEVFDALSDMTDQTQRTATASKLLGKSATELAPAMNSGSDAIEDMRDSAHDLGLVMSDEAVNAGVSYADALDQLERQMKSLKTRALLPLISTINSVASAITGQENESDTLNSTSAKLETAFEDLKTANDNYNKVITESADQTDILTQAMIAQASASRQLALSELAKSYRDIGTEMEESKAKLESLQTAYNKSETEAEKYANSIGKTVDELASMSREDILSAFNDADSLNGGLFEFLS